MVGRHCRGQAPYVADTSRERVPYRTIAATIGMVLLTYLALRLVQATARVLVWTVIAGFFAVAFYPLVNRVDRWFGGRRWLATLVVFLGAVVIIAGLVTLFVVPLAQQTTNLVQQAPDLYQRARAGRGPLGELFVRYHVDDYLQRNQGRIREIASGLGTTGLHVVQTAAQTVAAVLTIFVLAYLMVLEGPLIVAGTLTLTPERHRERVRRLGSECARTVTGYLSGNLLISVICGALTFVVLLAFQVPFAGLIALFVAIADLIPLVGATLGAVVAAAAGFFQSLTAGIAVIVFFVVYQQVENHLLQPVILSRAVKLNPLTVLLAILVGVELQGLLGALLAIPVAGMLQVIVRDLYTSRRDRVTPQEVAAEDEVATEEVAAEEEAPEEEPEPEGAGPPDGAVRR
jgi:predicted PurR-regulated permease PerM